ncbi:unnamed protein product [Arabis nemorensis]|uniref:Uncharacterized protein n=1 Tax=Arabis nemorensis TaxID=586526 RepID=A0A565BRP9_9BRAS|nr:unnamed protein product [Arabis nemorensis]
MFPIVNALLRKLSSVLVTDFEEILFVQHELEEELGEIVLKEFGEPLMGSPSVALSDWPPNSKELATGLKTPLVILTSDGSIRPFNRGFVESEVGLTSSVGEVGLTTPVGRFKRRDVFEKGSTSGIASQIISDNVSVNMSTSWFDANQCVSDDVALVAAVERLEAEIESEEDLDSQNGDEECDAVEVRPEGFDREWWSPFLEEAYGGSNAGEEITSSLCDKDLVVLSKEVLCGKMVVTGGETGIEIPKKVAPPGVTIFNSRAKPSWIEKSE